MFKIRSLPLSLCLSLCRPSRSLKPSLGRSLTTWPTAPSTSSNSDSVSSNSDNLPVFTVSSSNGFLPRTDPIADLPEPQFSALNSLLHRMSLVLPDGSKGLLATGHLGPAVEKELPMYNVDMITSQTLLMALFRDYTFLASAYLLEPCDIMNKTRGTYGLGRPVLPKNIAVPLQIISDKIKAKPFMEYAQSYALYNYKRKDKSKPLDYDNLELIRKFSGMPSEHGFILVHVAMVRHTGELVDAVIKALEAASKKERAGFNKNVAAMVAVMQKINSVMEEMWAKSLPEDYGKFRAFIMGIKGQTEMFPNGVIYEGVDPNPRAYRGESGANDSIIPTCDNFLQLTSKMPSNEMTAILKDFRSYRPINHTEWLHYVETSAAEVGVEAFARQDARSLVLYIRLLDQVRDFRHRHWAFAKEYIIKRSAYPQATGGSPMATWLPNQLTVVLDAIGEQVGYLGRLGGVGGEEVGMIGNRADAQARILKRDVEEFKQKFAKGE